MNSDERMELKELLALDGYRILLKVLDGIEAKETRNFINTSAADEKSIIHAKLRLEGVQKALNTLRIDLEKVKGDSQD